jgi:hypothetical protein
LAEKDEEEYLKKYGSKCDELQSDVGKPATGRVLLLFIAAL